jgi:hypothetical protein
MGCRRGDEQKAGLLKFQGGEGKEFLVVHTHSTSYEKATAIESHLEQLVGDASGHWLVDTCTCFPHDHDSLSTRQHQD